MSRLLQTTMPITSVSKASRKSESLKTTVPEEVVQELGIKDKDKIHWRTEKHGKEIIAIIKKLELQ